MIANDAAGLVVAGRTRRADAQPFGFAQDRCVGAVLLFVEALVGWLGGNREDKATNLRLKMVGQGKPREERPQRFDPDSPFAKLAALRDQLKK